jgi:hypothetical protein
MGHVNVWCLASGFGPVASGFWVCQSSEINSNVRSLGLCALQAMQIKHGIRFKLMAAGLRMAGHKKVADMIKSSWKVSPTSPFIH